jgi:murein DD-endopeptidase MepM/ murein hydrolase activator NlpD
MPGRILLAALLAAAVTGDVPEPEPPPYTRYPAHAFPIISQFGAFNRIDGGRRAAPNPGVDIIARVRTPVYAAAHGTVTLAATEPERGRVVEIATSHTEPAYTLIYTHLHTLAVAEGAPVRAGAPVGQVGDTGQVPRGIAFLHFELRLTDGGPVNPEPLFRARPEGRVECVAPERAAKPPEAGGYAWDRFAETRRGARAGAPLLYPVACVRGS